MRREIALLTNPTSGRGKGGRARDAALARLRERRAHGARPGRPRRRRGARPGPAGVADGVEALVVLRRRRHGAPRRPGRGRHRDRRSGSSRPAPATTWRATSTCPARTRWPPPTACWRPGARTRTDRPGPERRRRTSSTVLAAGFDALVNERANRMTWPTGPDALQPRHPGRAARRSGRCPTPSTSTASTPARRDAGRGRQRAVVRRRAADHRGRAPRRRPARRGRHQADEQARTGADLPQAVQGHPRHPPAVRAPPGAQRDRRGAGHRRRTPTASGSAPCR